MRILGRWFQHRVLSVLSVLLALSFNNQNHVEAFNLDVKNAMVFKSPTTVSASEAHFGYSVTLYSSPTSTTNSWVLVGAPRANSTSTNLKEIPEPGSLYACALNGAALTENTCKQIVVDPTGNVNNGGGSTNERYMDCKNNSWLGVSLDLMQQNVGSLSNIVITCGHRWSNQVQLAQSSDLLMNGVCYWAVADTLISDNFLPRHWTKHTPLVLLNEQITENSLKSSLFNYYYGQVGMSVHIAKGGQLALLGAPGVLQWNGTISTLKSKSWINGAQTYTYKPIPHTTDYDYFGYSVTSGRFWGNEDSMVAGAPRTNSMGKVFVFKAGSSSMEVQWWKEGPQMGCGFGQALTTADVNGDTWSELLVGAPLYFQPTTGVSTARTGLEEGLVLVYSRAGENVLALEYSLKGTATTNARFGSALTNLGDLDKDGYQDIAVGDPSEDGGRGAVYVFRGSAKGLLTSAQKIMAKDISSSLLGFGMAFSRGLDVDNNKYPDVVVGAPFGKGAAVVLKARPVVTLVFNVSATPSTLTSSGTPFYVNACVMYSGENVQPSSDIALTVTLDSGRTTGSRAMFVTSATSQATLKRSVTRKELMCTQIQAKLKDSEQYDLGEPLEIALRHSTEFSMGSTWCSSCGVLKPETPKEVKTFVILAQDCGDDGICTPSLSLISRLASAGAYVVGSGKVIGLLLQVRVGQGEPSFKTWLDVTLPPGLDYRSFPFSCSPVGGSSNRARCSLGRLNPGTDAVVNMNLVEVDGLSNGSTIKQVSILTSVGSGETLAARQATVSLPLKYDIDAYIFVYVPKEEVVYDSVVSFTFHVFNGGTTPLSGATVDIYVPVAFTADSTVMNFASITSAEIWLNNGATSCRDMSLGQNNNVPPGLPQPTQQGVGAMKEARCQAAGVLCQHIQCQVGPLTEYPFITVKMQLRMALIIDKYGNNTLVRMESQALITSLQGYDLTSQSPGNKPDATSAWVLVTPPLWVRPSLEPPKAPAWVYAVSALAGVTIIIVIVIVLWKYGFFKRKRASKGDPNKDGAAATELIQQNEQIIEEEEDVE